MIRRHITTEKNISHIRDVVKACYINTDRSLKNDEKVQEINFSLSDSELLEKDAGFEFHILTEDLAFAYKL